MKRLIATLAALCLVSGTLWASDAPEVGMSEISQSVIRMSLVDGVGVEEAGRVMVSKAAELNLKLVGRQPLHEEVRARGIESPHLEVFQFCAPEDAVKMARINPLYSVYMPCRISLVEDSEGRAWLYMLNLDMLINSISLPADLQAIAIRVNQAMLAVMTAGATGEL